MQELIDKLQADHGLSAEQSHGVLGTITNFIKEKFPMAEGMIDNLFHHDSSAPSGTDSSSQATNDPNLAGDSSINKGGSFLDKISDFIPGQAGEKVEQFAKDKLGGMFGGNK